MKKNTLVKVVIIFIVLVWILGEVIIKRTNPEQKYTGVILTQEADKIIKRSCFDCHSHETVFPWYSRLPFFSLIMGMHINEGRKHLNFSKWDTVPASKKPKIWGEILKEMDEGEMPIGNYLWLHPEARITKDDIQTLENALNMVGITPVRKGEHDHSEHEH